MLRDPTRREALIADAEQGPDRDACSHFYVLTPERGARYQPDAAWSLTAEADRRGVSPARAFVDLCLETEGRVILNWPMLNQDFGAVGEMLADPLVVMGLADSGAHVGQIMDASQPTWFLTYWVRERGLLPLADAVRRITRDTADFAGLVDRGTLVPGAFADLNVIDLDALALALPEYVRDFPGGAGRYVQRATGYELTVVNGEVLAEGGELTGAAGGRVLRSGPDRR